MANLALSAHPTTTASHSSASQHIRRAPLPPSTHTAPAPLPNHQHPWAVRRQTLLKCSYTLRLFLLIALCCAVTSSVNQTILPESSNQWQQCRFLSCCPFPCGIPIDGGRDCTPTIQPLSCSWTAYLCPFLYGTLHRLLNCNLRFADPAASLTDSWLFQQHLLHRTFPEIIF